MKTPADIHFEGESEGYRRMLGVLLLTTLISCVVTLVVTVLTGVLSSPRLVFTLIAAGVAALSYFYLLTSVRRATKVLIVGIWLTVSGAISWSAGVHSANLLIYTLLIVLSGWVLGTRWLLGLTAATIALVLSLAYLEFMGWYTPSARSNVLAVTGTLVGSFIAVSITTAVAYRSLKLGRDRAVQLSREMALQNQALVQRERDLQMIMNHVPAAIASFDSESRLRFGNQRYAALFGARPDQLVGRRIQDYVPQPTLQTLLPHWGRCLAGEAASYRRTNRDPLTGETRIFDVNLEPENHNTQVTGLFALMIDATDKVAADEHIRDLNATLERRVEQRTQELNAALDTLQRSQEELARSETRAALSTMIASVSHELSTPLGNSLMTASTLHAQSGSFQKLLDSNQLKRSELNTYLEAVRNGNDLLVRNLQRATELLGTFRQVSNDQASEQRRPFDLAATVKEIMDTLAPSLKRHPHRVALSIPDGIVLDSLPGALGQVVINLTNNAYLHAFEGCPAGIFTIGATVDDQHVVLRFVDNGVGISQDNLKRLFEPFFSTKKGKGGTGLGMGIVDNLVRKTLGGEMSVASELGRGTRIEVRLPLVAPLSAQGSQFGAL